MSKHRFVMYKALRSCGRKHIGETDQNLKVQISEHTSTNSHSALSIHLHSSQEHELQANHTEVPMYEKLGVRRKLVESLAILYSPQFLCNTGPSINISDMWFACTPHLRAVLSDN